MDRIEFVVAEQELPEGAQACAEPVINGERLTALLGPDPIYAGPPPATLLRVLDPAAERDDVQVLRCACGDDLCSWARVAVELGPSEVVWRDLRASHGDVDAHAALGPYRFPRADYERALAAVA